jgi:hypothetical protein
LIDFALLTIGGFQVLLQDNFSIKAQALLRNASYIILMRMIKESFLTSLQIALFTGHSGILRDVTRLAFKENNYLLVDNCTEDPKLTFRSGFISDQENQEHKGRIFLSEQLL